MTDLLGALREFRALEDRRAHGGLPEAEMARWHELRATLGKRAQLMAPPPPGSLAPPPPAPLPPAPELPPLLDADDLVEDVTVPSVPAAPAPIPLPASPAAAPLPGAGGGAPSPFVPLPAPPSAIPLPEPSPAAALPRIPLPEPALPQIPLPAPPPAEALPLIPLPAPPPAEALPLIPLPAPPPAEALPLIPLPAPLPRIPLPDPVTVEPPPVWSFSPSAPASIPLPPLEPPALAVPQAPVPDPAWEPPQPPSVLVPFDAPVQPAPGPLSLDVPEAPSLQPTPEPPQGLSSRFPSLAALEAEVTSPGGPDQRSQAERTIPYFILPEKFAEAPPPEPPPAETPPVFAALLQDAMEPAPAPPASAPLPLSQTLDALAWGQMPPAADPLAMPPQASPPPTPIPLVPTPAPLLLGQPLAEAASAWDAVTDRSFLATTQPAFPAPPEAQPPLQLGAPIAAPIPLVPQGSPPPPAIPLVSPVSAPPEPVPLQLSAPVPLQLSAPEQPTVVLGPGLAEPPPSPFAQPVFELTQDVTLDDADLPEVVPETEPPLAPKPPSAPPPRQAVPTPPPRRTAPTPTPVEPVDRSQLFGDFLRPASVVPGEHRVVVHTLAGPLKRGLLREADMHADALELWPQGGGAAERIPVAQMKAVFFMLAPGAAPPSPTGKRVTVSFEDGRQLTGFSEPSRPSDPGFFMVPADSRANTARIFVFRAAVHGLAEG